MKIYVLIVTLGLISIQCIPLPSDYVVMNFDGTLLTYIIRSLMVKKRKQWQGISTLFVSCCLLKLNNTVHFNGSLDMLLILDSGWARFYSYEKCRLGQILFI